MSAAEWIDPDVHRELRETEDSPMTAWLLTVARGARVQRFARAVTLAGVEAARTAARCRACDATDLDDAPPSRTPVRARRGPHPARCECSWCTFGREARAVARALTPSTWNPTTAPGTPARAPLRQDELSAAERRVRPRLMQERDWTSWTWSWQPPRLELPDLDVWGGATDVRRREMLRVYAVAALLERGIVAADAMVEEVETQAVGARRRSWLSRLVAAGASGYVTCEGHGRRLSVRELTWLSIAAGSWPNTDDATPANVVEAQREAVKRAHARHAGVKAEPEDGRSPTITPIRVYVADGRAVRVFPPQLRESRAAGAAPRRQKCTHHVCPKGEHADAVESLVGASVLSGGSWPANTNAEESQHGHTSRRRSAVRRDA